MIKLKKEKLFLKKSLKIRQDMRLTRMKINLLLMLLTYQLVELSKQSEQFAQLTVIKPMHNMVMSILPLLLFVRLVIMHTAAQFLVSVFSITSLQQPELLKKNTTKEKL